MDGFSENAPAAAAGMSGTPSRPPGFRGRIDRFEIVPGSGAPHPAPAPPDEVDLKAMAAGAMHYLAHNPVAEDGYRCRFGIDLLHSPPAPERGDPVSLGDTECRMDWEFIFMREISGLEEGRQAEEAIRRRIMGYIRDDGLCWVPPYCLCGLASDEPVALTWTTDKVLRTLVELYVRTGDPEAVSRARRLVAGLRGLASWDRGRAYYPGGMGGYDRDGWMYARAGCSDLYPCILDSVVRYYEATEDPEALAFAQAFAEGMVDGLQDNLGDNRIRPDGSFGGYNCHLHMRAVLGVAHLGAATGDPRLVEWSRRSYDWLMSVGAEWGWFPEGPPPDGPGHANSETCATGDMADLAARIAAAGHPRYWDDLERFVRNYLRQAQFFPTPAYEALYRETHGECAATEAGLRRARDFAGGFVARLAPNSLVLGRTMNMMGCCPPEGMRALYIAWSNIATESPEGVRVNLCLSRDAPQARVIASGPGGGRLTVVAKVPGRFLLRPPSWAPRAQVAAYRMGRPVPVVWAGEYIGFADVARGEELAIAFPVARFTQRVEVAGREYAYGWLGNAVTRVEPAGEGLGLFAPA
jgi:hypothetical protein